MPEYQSTTKQMTKEETDKQHTSKRDIWTSEDGRSHSSLRHVWL